MGRSRLVIEDEYVECDEDTSDKVTHQIDNFPNAPIEQPSANRVSIIQSLHLSVFYYSHSIHITLDTWTTG